MFIGPVPTATGSPLESCRKPTDGEHRKHVDGDEEGMQRVPLRVLLLRSVGWSRADEDVAHCWARHAHRRGVRLVAGRCACRSCR